MFFNKKEMTENNNSYLIKITALLIHAAKIDEKYSDKEEKIIKKTLIDLGADENQVENLIELSGNITFYTDDDDQFKSDYALFSTNNDLIEFKENIKHLKGKNMITANQSKIKNDFNYIIYEGNVSTTLFIE